MNSPGSPLPRGRGRGRQKEMSANERVTNWVNQREAKRLNKERWANRGSGENSQTWDERHEDDSQMLAKQETEELESVSDRSAAKRHNVQLYVPPSLRAKKESEAKGDSLDLEVYSSACKKAGNDDVHQKSVTSYKAGASEESIFKPDSEDQQRTCEISRTKQRGRGRRKPEVEIYVPRALRTARHESKSFSGIQTGNDIKNLSIETHEKTDSVHCDTKLDTDVLALHSSPQVQVFSEELHNYISHSDIPHQPNHTNYKSELNVQCDISGSQAILTDDLATKKVKYELTTGSELASTTSASVSTTMKATSNEQSPSEDVGNFLTFEFYDPAVIAFLPSAQYVQESHDTSTSYSLGISGQGLSELEGSYPINENGIECSPQPDIQPQVQFGADECQSLLSPIYDDAVYSFLNKHQETEEECSHGKMNSEDVSLNQKSEHLIIEQASITDSPKCSEMEDDKVGSSTMQDDSLIPEIPASDISMLGCSTNIDLCEDVITGKTDFSISGVSQKDISSNSTDISMIGCGTDIDLSEDLMIDRTDLSVSELSQKDIVSSTSQKATQNSSHHLISEDGVERQLLNSKKSETDVKQTDQISRDIVQEEGDTWDCLFDDNGDCLDDALITELEEYVGKVEIDKPRINYFNYEPKEPEMDYQGFSHILEIYDFSPDLATCDLISAFREFSSRGFDVKWVDDTHALGIFSSSVAANEALKMIHPLLKLRPLSEASKKGQSKARHCQEFLQPYKARPETTSIAARRLVAGALGMSTQVSREVRERERQMLKEAKEKRRQERQQKVDVWDGSFGKCAMDED